MLEAVRFVAPLFWALVVDRRSRLTLLEGRGLLASWVFAGEAIIHRSSVESAKALKDTSTGRDCVAFPMEGRVASDLAGLSESCRSNITDEAVGAGVRGCRRE